MRSKSAQDYLIYASCAIATAVLAFMTTEGVLERTHGVPAVPLDDTYIHFQYARSFAGGHPFRYTPGAPASPGATSLLWPVVLAPFYAIGFRGDRIIWAAWALGWVSLALLAVETRRLAEGLVRPSVAALAMAMVLAFGGFTWFAASGMEVVPFAWLMARATRRAAEWVEGGPTDGDGAPRPTPAYAELVALSVLCPLMRPEGVLGSFMIGVALLSRRDRNALRALPAFAGPVLSPLVCLAFTGSALTSTALAKWLPLNPYFRGAPLCSAVAANLGIFFGTLLNGELWTSVFLPEGGRVVGWLAFVAPMVLGVSRGRPWRGMATVALACGMLIPTTYETFLVNRVRYIWPFAPGLIVGCAALTELVGGVVERAAGRFAKAAAHVPAVLAGVVVGLFWTRLSPSMSDLATSSEAVTLQQVALGKWAGASLPAEARIGVNDTGAIAYFSSRTTFDVVGLTTKGEAKYWAAGAGSRFEHYEKLPASQRPTHFIVYPEWMAVDSVLGDLLALRTVHHTILGGATMAAFTARYDRLGSGELPVDGGGSGRELVDVLDVADLESERAHGYRLYDATKANDVVVDEARYSDGGRRGRSLDVFWLRFAGGGRLVLRLGAALKSRVSVRADGRVLSEVDVDGSPAKEVAVDVPADFPAGEHTVEVVPVRSGDTFDSLHYWAYR